MVLSDLVRAVLHTALEGLEQQAHKGPGVLLSPVSGLRSPEHQHAGIRLRLQRGDCHHKREKRITLSSSFLRRCAQPLGIGWGSY